MTSIDFRPAGKVTDFHLPLCVGLRRSQLARPGWLSVADQRTTYCGDTNPNEKQYKKPGA
ncbi:MAG: hypothetical protein ABI748_05620 [Dokdonella sp.]